jgi:hypothetical protein
LNLNSQYEIHCEFGFFSNLLDLMMRILVQKRRLRQLLSRAAFRLHRCIRGGSRDNPKDAVGVLMVVIERFASR